jgi:two-component system, chemotaxis family, chemotaxis protein CheY
MVRVLVIDDSRAIRAVLRRMLVEMGFEVAEAGNGREALAVLAGDRPDLCLVDWNMPEMDGLSFVQAVRADAAFAEMPLLMVTTESEMERVIEALTAGANEYLMKPFTKDALEAKLELLGVLGPSLA